MELVPLVLLTAAIVIALVLYNVGYAVFLRDAWNERRNRAREPDAIDRLHEAVTQRARTAVPDRFRRSGIRAHLTGQDRPCARCAPLRGRLYAHDDPDAPRLPLEGCEHPRGCTCEYV